MSDYAATLQRLVLSRTLWLVLAWPLVGLAWQVFVARPRIERSRDAGAALRELGRARVAGFGCLALAATAVAGHAFLLLRLPPGARTLFEPLARGPRLGDVDAGLDLLLDLRALVACALACAVALASGGALAARPASERGWRRWAWLHLALAGVLASLLADGFVLLAMGWSLAAAAAVWLAAKADVSSGEGAGARGALSLALLLTGAGLLFWGLGGSWDADGYARDARPRFAAVHAGSTGAGGEAWLTMTTAAGARVFVDDARMTGLVAPFVRAPVAGGGHALRIHLGDGAEDAVVARFEAAPGEEVAVVPLGPTLSFHAMAEQMALRDRSGQLVARRAAEDHVGPGGVAVVAGALLALLGAAFAASGAGVTLQAPRAMSAMAAGASTTALGPFLLLRLDFLLPSAQHGGAVVAAAGAAALLAGVWRALDHDGAARWRVFSAHAPPGLACVALGLGGAAQGLGVLVVTGLAAAATHLLAARPEGEVEAAEPEPAARPSALVRVAARSGDLLASMERWVVGSAASAAGAVARIAAWMVATADEHLVATPGDVAASGVRRAARAIEPRVGASPAAVAWALLAAGAAAALVHALWPRS